MAKLQTRSGLRYPANRQATLRSIGLSGAWIQLWFDTCELNGALEGVIGPFLDCF